MMFKIFMILFNFIVNTIKLNSLNIGIITAPIINPNGKFYDFINNEPIGYSKLNRSNCTNNIIYQFHGEGDEVDN